MILSQSWEVRSCLELEEAGLFADWFKVQSGDFMGKCSLVIEEIFVVVVLPEL